MLTVACVYWRGSWEKNPGLYTSEWVDKLKNMVSRNMSVPYQFVCLTNTEVNCEKISLINDWPGWWSKLELFRPGLFDDKVLYLDLDVLILKDLTELVTYPSPFILAKGHATHGLYINRGKGLEIRRYQGSVMCFERGMGTDLYTNFKPETDIPKYYSDEDYIGDVYQNLETYPESWIKKLEECPKGIPPEGTKIVLCIPEKNDIAVNKYPWVKDIWK